MRYLILTLILLASCSDNNKVQWKITEKTDSYAIRQQMTVQQYDHLRFDYTGKPYIDWQSTKNHIVTQMYDENYRSTYTCEISKKCTYDELQAILLRERNRAKDAWDKYKEQVDALDAMSEKEQLRQEKINNFWEGK